MLAGLASLARRPLEARVKRNKQMSHKRFYTSEKKSCLDFISWLQLEWLSFWPFSLLCPFVSFWSCALIAVWVPVMSVNVKVQDLQNVHLKMKFIMEQGYYKCFEHKPKPTHLFQKISRGKYWHPDAFYRKIFDIFYIITHRQTLVQCCPKALFFRL